jgi:hypothetical protein
MSNEYSGASLVVASNVVLYCVCFLERHVCTLHALGMRGVIHDACAIHVSVCGFRERHTRERMQCDAIR